MRFVSYFYFTFLLEILASVATRGLASEANIHKYTYICISRLILFACNNASI